jgi:hypothetical protein
VGDKAQQRVKLYLDHDISYRIAEQLRARGHDTSEQLGFGETLRRLLRFLETVTAMEMRDMIRNLAEFKGPR